MLRRPLLIEMFGIIFMFLLAALVRVPAHNVPVPTVRPGSARTRPLAELAHCHPLFAVSSASGAKCTGDFVPQEGERLPKGCASAENRPRRLDRFADGSRPSLRYLQAVHPCSACRCSAIHIIAGPRRRGFALRTINRIFTAPI